MSAHTKHASTKARVQTRPECDFCKHDAYYDGKTKVGPWAYMCPVHFKAYGTGLGLGRGQWLLIEEEEPPC